MLSGMPLGKKLRKLKFMFHLLSSGKKREQFDMSYVKKFAPRRFDKFAFSPSRGAS